MMEIGFLDKGVSHGRRKYSGNQGAYKEIRQQ
jgi:hypothetical protein